MTPRWLSVLVLGLAAIVALTGCAGQGALRGTAPDAADMAEAPAAPVLPEKSGPASVAPEAHRDVVKTATMRVTVTDTTDAADRAADIATEADGRVDNRTDDAGSGAGRAQSTVTLRVPADRLDDVLEELETLGFVQNLDTRVEDVTAQRVDLDARITALQTSVERLLSIMRDARDPEALISAEDALSERQAELDSLRAQRTALGDRIAYSTVAVTFTAEQVGGPAPQRYEGFFGQVKRGWDNLTEAAGDLFLLFGYLLPWLAALAVVAAVGVGLVQALRRIPRLSNNSRSASDKPPQIP
ncbi:DUF4349 domain-containing protein [[Mycobacterium] wendilense]|uniref:DUF4349 domain-containing protein n=1 Tax=[Mycobacterium] wendilense TaxID=3064284 RepID=A0ABM9MH41_9MYCO|nr:DUF4349 domain-containing protein [Mycolicibacterium sp. MU0050]CAJ1585088.1 DUF4349 domain-containing protein [Mycolicibacterium sp. MU0050]